MKALIIVLLIAVVGGFVFLNRSVLLPAGAPFTGFLSPTPIPAANAGTAVTLTINGFDPQTITVPPGSRITWTNQTENVSTVNSDDHPDHLKWPFLNLGQFSPGSTLTVVFPTAPGTYTYHDHLHPEFKGSVVIK